VTHLYRSITYSLMFKMERFSWLFWRNCQAVIWFVIITYFTEIYKV